MFVIKLRTPVKEIAAGGDNLASWRLPQVENEIADAGPTLGFGQGIGYLHENPVSGEHSGAKVPGEVHDALVMLVAPIEPRHEVKRVGENEAHWRGWPCT